MVYAAGMRIVWLSLLLITLPACSDDSGDADGDAAGRGGSSAGNGNGGSSFAGNAGSSTAGSGNGGSSFAGSGGVSNAAGSGGGGAGGSGGSSATGCAAFCERSLDECENDDAQECFDSCDNSAELCPAESAALIECALPRPDSDFYCEMGITTAKEGVCDAEATALLLCLF